MFQSSLHVKSENFSFVCRYQLPFVTQIATTTIRKICYSTRNIIINDTLEVLFFTVWPKLTMEILFDQNCTLEKAVFLSLSRYQTRKIHGPPSIDFGRIWCH